MATTLFASYTPVPRQAPQDLAAQMDLVSGQNQGETGGVEHRKETVDAILVL